MNPMWYLLNLVLNIVLHSDVFWTNISLKISSFSNFSWLIHSGVACCDKKNY